MVAPASILRSDLDKDLNLRVTGLFRGYLRTTWFRRKGVNWILAPRAPAWSEML